MAQGLATRVISHPRKPQAPLSNIKIKTQKEISDTRERTGKMTTLRNLL
jgi:hypothetical protein